MGRRWELQSRKFRGLSPRIWKSGVNEVRFEGINYTGIGYRRRQQPSGCVVDKYRLIRWPHYSYNGKKDESFVCEKVNREKWMDTTLFKGRDFYPHFYWCLGLLRLSPANSFWLLSFAFASLILFREKEEKDWRFYYFHLAREVTRTYGCGRDKNYGIRCGLCAMLELEISFSFAANMLETQIIKHSKLGCKKQVIIKSNNLKLIAS